MKSASVVMQNLARLAVIALVVASAAGASAQVANSGAQAIALNASLTESLTVSLSANAVNFTLASGSAANAGSANVTATTAWVLKPGRTALGVWAYFATTTALTDGTNNIPSSAFKISDNGGTSTGLTTVSPFNAAADGFQLANVPITALNRAGTRNDIMAFNIDLSTGTLPQLPASVYTGTLNIQAQATP
jgi:hypothetical protein